MSKRKLESPTDTQEKEIAKGIAADSDNPEWSDDMFEKATRGRPPMPEAERRKPVTIRLDPQIIDHFKGKNPKGWQTRINDALRKAAGL